MVVALGFAANATATVYTYTDLNHPRHFSNAANWAGGMVPPSGGSGDVIYINGLCALDVNFTVGSSTLLYLLNYANCELFSSVTLTNNGDVLLNNDIYGFFINGTMQNNGTLSVNDNVVINGVLSSSGTILINGGNFSIVNGGTLTNSGTLNHTSSAALSCSGTLNNSGTFNNNSNFFQNTTGSFNMTGGTLTNTSGWFGDGANTVSAGTFTTSGLMTIGGALNIQGTASFTNTATCTFYTASSLTNSASMTNTGTLTVHTGATFNNNAAGVFTNNATFNVTGTLNNNGTLKGTGTLSGNFTNTGTMAPGTSPGTFSITGDYSQTPAGNYQVEIEGTNPWQIDLLNISGTAALNGTLSISFINGFNPSGCIEFTVMNFSGSTGSFSNIAATGDWVVEYLPTSLKLKFYGSSKTFIGGGGDNLWSNHNNWAECLAPSGTVTQPVTITADCQMDIPITLQNSLTINATRSLNVPASQTLAIHAGGSLTNNGTLNLHGTLNASGNFTNTGTANIISTATLLFTEGSTSTNSGTMHLGGLSQTLSGAFTNDATGVVNLSTTLTVAASGVFNNNGTFNTGGTLNLNGTFSNAAAATLNLTSGSATTNNATLTNAGNMLVFASASLVNAAGSTLTNSGTLTNLHVFQNNAGATFLNNGSFLQNATFDNTGTLGGTGAMTAANWSNNGTLAPGASPGTFTLSGNYTSGGGSIFNAEIGGAVAGQFDVLAVSGTAALGGTLNVSLINSFSPSACTEWQIMTFSSSTGSFATVNFPSPASDWRIEYNSNNITVVYGGNSVKQFAATSNDLWTNHDNWSNCVAPSGTVTGQVSIFSNGTLDDHIAIDNELTITNPYTLTIQSTKSLTINAAANFYHYGTLVLNGSFTNLGAIVGTGNFNGNFTNQGSISPNGTASMSVTGDYTHAATATYLAQIAGTGAGQYDQLSVSGAVQFGGTLSVSLQSFTPAICNEFVLMTYASRTGTFATVNLPTPANEWVLDYNATNLTLRYVGNPPSRTFTGGGGNDLWSNDDNWAECYAPAATSSVPVTIAANCILDENMVLAANLTVNAGRTFTINPAVALTVNAAATLGNNGSVVNAGNLTVAGNMTFPGGGSNFTNQGNFEFNNPATNMVLGGTISNSGDFFVTSANSIAINTPIASTGTGEVEMEALTYISVSSGSNLSTENGALLLRANESGSATGNFTGFQITGAVISSSGSGNISIRGKGGDGAGSDQTGVLLQNAQINCTGSGSVTLLGEGGTGLGGSIGVGIRMESSSQINTASGSIQLTGQGGGGTTTSTADGISVQTSCSITAGGMGNITLTGTGGTSTISSKGILFYSNSYVSSSNGNMSLTGLAGTSSNSGNYGIHLGSNSYASTTGNGSLTLAGTGGSSSSNENHGIYLESIGAFASTLNGNISLTGQGGSGGGTSCGVALFNSAEVKSTGSGVVSVNGTGGTGGNGNNGICLQVFSKIWGQSGNVSLVANAVSGNSAGLLMSSANVYALSGDLSIEGTASGTASGILMENALDRIGHASATGNITLITDRYAGYHLQSSGALTLRPKTASTSIGIGGASGDLSIDDNELFYFANGFSSITLGNAAAGTGAVSIETATFNDPATIVGGSVLVNGTTTSDNLTLTARTANVRDDNDAGDDVTCGNLSVNTPSGALAPGSSPGIFSVSGNYTHTGNLAIEIAGTAGAGHPTNGHDQLSVSGTLTLGGTLTVTFINGFTPSAGDMFVIATMGARVGTFNTLNLPGNVSWTVSYTSTQVVLNAVALPVELLFFSAEPQEGGVLLQWATANETNADRFDIEHSTDGLRFAKIGERQAAGTTQVEQQYDFLHENPVAGVVNYYRLRQMDFDGKEEFSQVVAIDLLALGALTGLGLRAYPNPVTGGELTIVLPENLEEEIPLQLFDSSGRLVRSAVLGGGANVLDVRGLAMGVYTLQAGRFYEKIVVD
jgi:hypothetical protein